MTALEHQKLFCSVTFHIVAITCVIWSLYVLIDRTVEEIRNSELQWPFWTKLAITYFLCRPVDEYIQRPNDTSDGHNMKGHTAESFRRSRAVMSNFSH